MTGGDEQSACPSAEMLHHFIEGLLDSKFAMDLVKHFEECHDCRFIIRESLSLLESEDRSDLESHSAVPRRRWRLALAAVVFLILTLQFFTSSEDRRFDHALARTPVRPTEGRLSGIPYEKYAERRGGTTSPGSRLIVLADSVLARQPRSAAEWHRHGVASLVRGDVSVAVVSLVKAADFAPRTAAYRSDLAAARIAAGMAADDARMLGMATRDALRAQQIDPDLAEALFNLAVSLERRGLLSQARIAYSKYLRIDDHSQWAMEVHIRLANLR